MKTQRLDKIKRKFLKQCSTSVTLYSNLTLALLRLCPIIVSSKRKKIQNSKLSIGNQAYHLSFSRSSSPDTETVVNLFGHGEGLILSVIPFFQLSKQQAKQAGRKFEDFQYRNKHQKFVGDRDMLNNSQQDFNVSIQSFSFEPERVW